MVVNDRRLQDDKLEVDVALEDLAADGGVENKQMAFSNSHVQIM